MRRNFFIANSDGNVALISALLMPVIALVVGGGINFADAAHRRSALQDTLDAAVLAGAARGGRDADNVTIAMAFFKANLAPSIADAEARFTTSGRFITGVGSTTMPTLFSGLFGQAEMVLGAQSKAEHSTIGVCLLGLNGLDNGAFDINGNPEFSAPDCAVQANSGGSRAMTQEGRAIAKAGLFAVHGGSSTNNFSPAPKEGRDRVADPYADIPFLPHDACTSTKSKALNVTADITLQPGTYCGGIDITGSGVNVTMAPGRYVMVDGPLLVRGNAQLKGREVVVGFTGSDSTLRVWGNGSVDLTSPTSGTYANMQFFQNRDDAKGRGAWVSIGGNGGPSSEIDQSKLSIDGAAYFPTQNFWVFGNAEATINSPGLGVVADKIWFQGSAKIAVTTEDRRNIGQQIESRIPFGARLVS